MSRIWTEAEVLKISRQEEVEYMGRCANVFRVKGRASFEALYLEAQVNTLHGQCLPRSRGQSAR